MASDIPGHALFPEEGQLFLLGLGREEERMLRLEARKVDGTHAVKTSACPLQQEGSHVLKPRRDIIISVFYGKCR